MTDTAQFFDFFQIPGIRHRHMDLITLLHQRHQHFFSEIIQPGIAVSKHQYALFHPSSFLLQLFVSEP